MTLYVKHVGLRSEVFAETALIFFQLICKILNVFEGFASRKTEMLDCMF